MDTKRIEKLHPTVLDAVDTLDIADQAVPVIRKAVSDDPYVDQLVGDVISCSQNLRDVINKVPGCIYTLPKAHADKNRSSAFIALRDYTHAWLGRFDVPESVSIAANTIQRIIARYGVRLYELRSAEKTVRIDSLLNELKKEKNVEALKQFDGQSWVDNLNSYNNTFKEIREEKVAMEANNGSLHKNEAKEIVVYYLNLLFGHIGYVADKNGSSFDSLVDGLNEIIEEVLAVVKARKTREENNGAGDDKDIKDNNNASNNNQ